MTAEEARETGYPLSDQNRGSVAEKAVLKHCLGKRKRSRRPIIPKDRWQGRFVGIRGNRGAGRIL